MNPPTLIGGSTPPRMERGCADGVPFFDAYCTTVFAHSSEVLDVVEQALMDAGHETSRTDGGKVRHYAHNVAICDRFGHRLASVRHGGHNPHPFLECKGAATRSVVAGVREAFAHRPSRIDIAVDRTAPGLFEEWNRIGTAVLDRYGMREPYDQGRRSPDKGKTVEFGSRKSVSFVRVYQKGLQLAEKLGLEGDDIPDDMRNYVRFEYEFKPDTKKGKEIATRFEPAQFFGCSPWVRDFATEALAMASEPISICERRESDRDRALRFMGAQYSRHLESLFQQHQGDDAAFGRAIRLLAGIGFSDASEAA